MKEIKVELTLQYSDNLPWDDVAALSYIVRQLKFDELGSQVVVTSIKKKED